MFESTESLQTWMFFAVTCGLSLIAILLSIAASDHGRDRLDEARKHLARTQRALAKALSRVAAIQSAYQETYSRIRSHALHVIEIAKELFNYYVQVLEQHSITKKEVLLPEIPLPAELDAEAPPALSTVVAEYRARQGGLK